MMAWGGKVGRMSVKVRNHFLRTSNRRLPPRENPLANSQCQGLRFHAVLNGEPALLEQFAGRPMRFLARIPRDSAGLFGKGEIAVAGPIGRLHRLVAGQRRRDAELLLRPVTIGQAVTG